MIDNKTYYEQSLVNHIYFAGTIRSFCTTIGLSFFKNNQEYIDTAISLGTKATNIINKTINLMNKEISSEVLANGVYITPYTEKLNLLTEKLFDINLVIDITKDKESLENRSNITYNDETIKLVNNLNNESLTLINDFKEYVQLIKNKLINNQLFSYLYMDFFDYMFDEISVYGRDIKRIESKNDYSNFYLKEFIYYFNELLRESAKYIRGFLDTSEQESFDKASYFVNAFAALTERYLKNKDMSSISMETEKLVINYKSYVKDLIEKLLDSKNYFIIPPITLDNFLTNINVYLFILKYVRKNI